MAAMTRRTWTMTDLLPHTGSAVLLDEVLESIDTRLSASVLIGPHSAFHREKGVPAHVGIEYMAQACGAFSGAAACSTGAAPRIGFLLGTRRYAAMRAWFADGERLVVTSDLIYRDDEVGVFDCVIRSGDEVIATAQLMVMEPKDISGLLNRQGGQNDA
jgi:predicted hotdog family 3-hydroxylacyl-ACP dehydratase